MVLTIFDEEADLAHFSTIVKSRSNPFLEPTSTKQ